MDIVTRIARSNQRFVLRNIRNMILTRNVSVEEVAAYAEKELAQLDSADLADEKRWEAIGRLIGQRRDG
jgi:hypothetical protein